MLVNKETEPILKNLGKNAALSLMKKEINAAAKQENQVHNKMPATA